MLYDADHDVKTVPWCGIIAAACITGRPSSEIIKLFKEVSAVNKKHGVRGVTIAELIYVLAKCGYVADHVFTTIDGEYEAHLQDVLYEYSSFHRKKEILLWRFLGDVRHFGVSYGMSYACSWSRGKVLPLDKVNKHVFTSPIEDLYRIRKVPY